MLHDPFTKTRLVFISVQLSLVSNCRKKAQARPFPIVLLCCVAARSTPLLLRSRFDLTVWRCLEMGGEGSGFTSRLLSSLPGLMLQRCSMRAAKPPNPDLYEKNYMNNKDEHFQLWLEGEKNPGAGWCSRCWFSSGSRDATPRQRIRGSACVTVSMAPGGENGEVQTSSHWTSRALDRLRKSLPHTLCSALI